MDEEYIRKSEVDRLIALKIKAIKENVGPGKGLKNSIINLQALKQEIDGLYRVTVKFKEEPPIWRKRP